MSGILHVLGIIGELVTGFVMAALVLGGLIAWMVNSMWKT